MTVVINLYGGPGSGKSTNAAGIFYKLKTLGRSAELVTEAAKDFVYDGANTPFTSQHYLTSLMDYKIHRLINVVDYIVVDSPLLISTVYANFEPSVTKYCQDMYKKYKNIDIFVKRTKPFIGSGRVHSEDESREVDEKLFNRYKFNFVIDSDENLHKTTGLVIEQEKAQRFNLNIGAYMRNDMHFMA